CPVNVDMATYKAEFLAHHYRGRVRPAAHYSMGWLPCWAQAASRAPAVVNAVAHAPVLSRVAKRLSGIAPQRDIPRFARQTFTSWFRARQGGPPWDAGRPEVLLWPDTFTNAFHPEVGQAAVRVLEAAGFAVRLPARPLCCGLTWISTGQLGVAKRVLRRTLDALSGDLAAGTPVVGLEPSCTAVLRSDLPELLPADQAALRLAGQAVTLAELLAGSAPGWAPPARRGRAVVQGHCHQHAVLGMDAEEELLRRTGLDVDLLPPSCCGLAGNFGFEAGHYDVSMAVGERVLLPAVRSAGRDDVVIADGFSCRTQIEQATGRRAVHLAQVLDPASPA
ncbi:MAG: (Fe-S)-binding protein, partial [Acidimicrobiales bacterium]